MEFCVQMSLYAYRELGEFDGSRYDYPDAAETWEAAREFLLSRDICHFDYLQAVFDPAHTAMRPGFSATPYPETLVSRRFFDRWRAAAQADYYRAAAEELDRGLRYFRDESAYASYAFDLAPRDGIATVLGDATTSLDPLLRHYLSLQFSFPAVAAATEQPALLQYLRRRRYYRRVWKDRIPSGIRESAAAFVGHFV